MFFRNHLNHKSGYAGPDINSWKMILIGQLAAQDNMAVQNPSYGICDRFVGIITLYQNRVYPGDGAFAEIAASLQKLRKFRID